MYKEVISPFLDRRDSETWHTRTREALHLAESNPLTLKILELIANQGPRFADERLKVVLGKVVELDNPVLVGAGWDKAGRAVKALYAMDFAGVEVGSVLAHPQEGNPKYPEPRQYIVGPGVSINWLGYNTPPRGMDDVEKNLKRYKESGIPIGINVGKNKELEKDEDMPKVYADVVEKFYEQAAYFALGFSPNTKDLAQAVADTSLLTDVIQRVHFVMDNKGARKPLYVKIGPDLQYASVDNIIRVVIDTNTTGIIAVNSTTNQNIKAKYGEKWRNDRGGLTGDDLDYQRMATQTVGHIYSQTKGTMEIIGVGGIKDAARALERIKAGATVVQVVTAIRGEGPTIASSINKGLAEHLHTENIKSISDLIGADHVNLAV